MSKEKKNIVYNDGRCKIVLSNSTTSEDMRYCRVSCVDLTKYSRFRVHDDVINTDLMISISPFPETTKFLDSTYADPTFIFIYNAFGKVIFVSDVGEVDGVFMAKVVVETIRPSTVDKKKKEFIIGRRCNYEG